jgi:molybdenum cofactor sulfurtransferase
MLRELIGYLAYNNWDAMAVSFYKMFGFPTGVGVLIVQKLFLEQLKWSWFGSGTAAVVQVSEHLVMWSHIIHEQFEVYLPTIS